MDEGMIIDLGQQVLQLVAMLLAPIMGTSMIEIVGARGYQHVPECALEIHLAEVIDAVTVAVSLHCLEGRPGDGPVLDAPRSDRPGGTQPRLRRQP